MTTFIYLLLVFIYRPNTSEQSAGSWAWCLGSSRIFICFSDCLLVIGCQVCRVSTELPVSTTLHYTIMVCCIHTAHSQHYLPAIVEACEINLKCTQATGELNSGSFTPAAKCITIRSSRPLKGHTLLLSSYGKSCMGFWLAYLHWTLVYSKGKGHAHSDCEYIVNGYRYGVHWYCHQIWRHMGFRLAYLNDLDPF